MGGGVCYTVEGMEATWLTAYRAASLSVARVEYMGQDSMRLLMKGLEGDMLVGQAWLAGKRGLQLSRSTTIPRIWPPQPDVGPSGSEDGSWEEVRA